MKPNDLTGQKFNRWTVLSREPRKPGELGGAKWRCRCDCGTEKCVESEHLIHGRSRSCGCLKNEEARARFTTHGRSKGRLYHAWHGMIRRCHDPKHVNYRDYGARGITVCDRWRVSFEAFLEDMGERPTPPHTIERVDNSGPYCKENCVWATRKRQNYNKRANHVVEFNGKTQCLAAWSEEVGIPSNILYDRINKLCWPVSRAFTERPKEDCRRKVAV